MKDYMDNNSLLASLQLNHTEYFVYFVEKASNPLIEYFESHINEEVKLSLKDNIVYTNIMIDKEYEHDSQSWKILRKLMNKYFGSFYSFYLASDSSVSLRLTDSSVNEKLLGVVISTEFGSVLQDNTTLSLDSFTILMDSNSKFTIELL